MKSKFLRRILAAASLAAMLCLIMSGCMPAGTSQEGGASSMLSTVGMLVVIVVVGYFFMIRPESKRKKKDAEMRESIAVGDKIATIGGMVGKIVNIKDETITFETGEDRVRIEVKKSAIASTGKPTE